MRASSLLILFLLLFLGSYSFAYHLEANTMEFPPAGDNTPKIDSEVRLDLTNSSVLTNPGPSTTVTSTGFVFNAIRPRLMGRLNDELNYVLRLNLVKTTAVSNRDNATDLIDLAYADYKIGELTLRIGKQLFAEGNGWESVYYLTDVFTYSTTFLNMNAKYNYYRTGLKASQSFGDHNFSVAVTNSTKTVTDTYAASNNNNGLAYGAYYNGSFLDGMIRPVASYTIFQIDGDPDTNPANFTNAVNDTLWAVGVRVVPIADLHLDFDYESLTQPTQNSLLQSNNQTTTTFRAEGTYKVGDFMPFVNFISDKFTGYGTIALPNATNFTKTSYDVGLMYYPFKDKNFRYHLMYSYATQTNDSSATTSGINSTNIRLGIKFDI